MGEAGKSYLENGLAVVEFPPKGENRLGVAMGAWTPIAMNHFLPLFCIFEFLL